MMLFIFKHLQASNRSWKIIHGGPGKVLDFFVSKRVGTMILVDLCVCAFVSLGRGLLITVSEWSLVAVDK